MKPRLLPLVAFAVLAIACSKSSKEKAQAGADPVGEAPEAPAKKAPEGPRDPLDIGAGEFGAMAIKNVKSGTVEMRPMVYNGKYSVSIQKAPKGTKWSAGALKGELNDEYGMIELVDLSDKFAGMKLIGGSVGMMQMTIDPGLTLTLDFPDGGPKGDVTLPPVMASNELEEMLKRVENGPVTFPGEPADEKPRENIIALQIGQLEVFGLASLVGDIDMIALTEKLPDAVGTKTCSGYKDSKDKALPAIEMKLVTTEVTIYDRRTADVVARKQFPPKAECPMFAFVQAGEAMESSAPTREISAWLKSQVKR